MQRTTLMVTEPHLPLASQSRIAVYKFHTLDDDSASDCQDEHAVTNIFVLNYCTESIDLEMILSCLSLYFLLENVIRST